MSGARAMAMHQHTYFGNAYAFALPWTPASHVCVAPLLDAQ